MHATPDQVAARYLVELEMLKFNNQHVSSYDITHPLLAMLLESQSRPSYRPSPDVAHVLWMYLHETKAHISCHALYCNSFLTNKSLALSSLRTPSDPTDVYVENMGNKDFFYF